MKYILYRDEIGADHVDIFNMLVNHDKRLAHIADEMGPVKLISAGKFKMLDAELDEFDVTPGSHTLNLDASSCDAAADQVAIKNAMMFF